MRFIPLLLCLAFSLPLAFGQAQRYPNVSWSEAASIAIRAVVHEHPELSPTNLIIDRVSYSYGLNDYSGKTNESLRVELIRADTIVTNRQPETWTKYFDQVYVTIDSENEHHHVSRISRRYVHRVKNSWYRGTVVPDDKRFIEPDLGRHFSVSDFAQAFPMKASVRDVLQLFADLTGESVEIVNYLSPDSKISIIPDTEIRTADQALQVIITALEANKITLIPVSASKSIADRTTNGPLTLP